MYVCVPVRAEKESKGKWCVGRGNVSGKFDCKC